MKRSRSITPLVLAASLLGAWSTGALHAKTPATAPATAPATGTAVIQKLLDDCAAAGGGRVVVPHGEFICGTLFLRSNVELHVPAGSAILGSQLWADYPTVPREGIDISYRSPALLVGENVSNVAITGQGLIDGRGTFTAFHSRRSGDEMDRPNYRDSRPLHGRHRAA